MSDVYDRRKEDAHLTKVRAYFDELMRDHEQREQQNVADMIEALKEEAFPDGAAKHRSAHEAMIEASRAEEAFWRGLREDIAKKSIWGILHVLMILLAAGLAAKMGLAIPFTK